MLRLVTRSRLHRYGTAVLAVELALVVMVLLDSLIPIKRSPFMLCFAAVIISAWYGGLGPALLATALVSLACAYFYLPLTYSLAIAPDDVLQLGLLMLEAVVIISLIVALHSKQRRAQDSAVKLRASEQRYNRIIDTAYQGIWTIDAEARTNYVNQRIAEMLGYTIEEMLGCPLYDFMYEADRTKAKRNFERSKQGIKQQYDFWFRRKNGSALIAIASISPLFSGSGEFLGTLGMIIDVTERKRAELALVQANAELKRNEERLLALVCQLQQQNKQLEEVSQLKSDFLANMSHELRTPLTSIMGFSSVLLQQVFGTLTVKQQEYLSCVHTSGEHLLGLINQLLDLAKIEAGKMELTIETVDLAELCGDALQMIEVRALEKHQHLSLELPIAIESIVVDRQRVLQILLNYLSNAVKFTPEGGTLTLSTRLSSSLELEAQMGAIDQSSLSTRSTPCFLVLSVSDTGIGIPLEKQHLLFQTFQQISGAFNRQDGGTGLGLALNRRLAELHGGTVSFTSTPGVGSTFSVWLPLSDQQL